VPGPGHLREGESLKTRHIEVDGLRLRVGDTADADIEPRRRRARRTAPAEPVPLLLLNGLSSPLEAWGELLVRLAPARRVIAFDAPGVGGSDTPRLPLTMRALAGIAASVASACDAPIVDVLGYSHGGVVAQQLAIDAPHRVGRLVLAATSWGAGAIPGHPLALAAATAQAALHSEPLARGANALGLGLAWQLAAVVSWSCLPWLRRVEAPTLVLSGAEDLVVPAINAHLLATLVPHGELVIVPGVGHELFHGEALDAVVPPIERFLDAGPAATLPLVDQASA
jgi:pimeloyl-ACP methyl ester carboxylesterase